MKLLIITTLLVLASCGRIEGIKDMHSRIDDNSNRIDELERRLDQYYTSLTSLETQIDSLDVDQDTLTQLVTNNVSSIATLELNTTVSAIMDPCGDNVGEFDEVILIMSDGSIVAYFEQGSNRFIGQLPDGNYRTTDKQRCNFSVVNGQYRE